jgi:metal-sulfur cluster biosynthetic enzyme
MSKHPTHPAHPERICWGCDEYCPADDLTCGKDTVRSPHPAELFGDDWQQWAEGRHDTPDEMTRSRVVEALRSVLDPEVGINIVDLGVLHEVHVNGSQVQLSLTLTSPSCPLGEQIRLEAAQRVAALKGVTKVEVTEVWDPPWSPERMSLAARQALGSP